MKKLYQPASLLLYILTIPVFFIAGAGLTAISGAADGQGLAGGAIVFMYGLIASVFMFIVAIFMAYNLEKKRIVKINQILAVLLLVFVLYTVIRMNNESNQESSSNLLTEDAPAEMLSKVGATKYLNIEKKLNHTLGLGFFKPDFFNDRILNFYNYKTQSSHNSNPSIRDSVVFNRDQYGNFEIFSAPPWLVPDQLKLDYGILFFKVSSVSRDYLEIVVNKTTGQTAWVSRSSGTLSYWPEFLLNAFSVENKNPDDANLKVKPLSNASPVNIAHAYLNPILIKGDWIQVEIYDHDDKMVTTAWLKWKNDNELLIKYYLLS